MEELELTKLPKNHDICEQALLVQVRFPSSQYRHSRPPRVNRQILHILLRSLKPREPLDVAIAACAVTAFWGQCRIADLLPKHSGIPFEAAIPSRANLYCSPTYPSSLILRLKDPKLGDRDVYLVSQNGLSNPLKILTMHLEVNPLPPHSPLFSYSDALGTHCLTQKEFHNRCNQVWSQYGLSYTNDSAFRIGAAAELISAGVSPELVMAMVRGPSDTLRFYGRPLHELVLIHVERLPTTHL